ncbi:YheT family hydrolase [Vulgatibacter incomptus]|nr:alpha/beta fold hydrolase [Vulgatibacter incomptus]
MRRERWELEDGDFLDLDVLPSPPTAPCVVILHGLEGSSRAGYVAAIVRGAERECWGAVALNFRSCSGEPNRLPRMYHSGDIGDARLVLERLRAEGRRTIFGVGFSLGGNVMLRLLAELGDSAPLKAAAAVSVPFDLAGCAQAIDRASGLASLYRWIFLRSLREKALEKARCFPGSLDPDAVRAAHGIVAFDDAATAPLHGFASAGAYYDACSSGPALDRIRRPTLCVSSEDDPMVPARYLPEPRNPLVELLVTRAGGHVGFVSGSLLRPKFWAEEQVLAFFRRTV